MKRIGTDCVLHGEDVDTVLIDAVLFRRECVHCFQSKKKEENPKEETVKDSDSV